MREIKWNTPYFKVWDGVKFWEQLVNPVNGIDEMYCGDVRDLIFLIPTGLKDKNGMGLTEVYEGDIISIDGILKGSIYENNKEPTDIIIPQLGTKAWNDAYKEAVARGYDYSE